MFVSFWKPPIYLSIPKTQHFVSGRCKRKMPHTLTLFGRGWERTQKTTDLSFSFPAGQTQKQFIFFLSATQESTTTTCPTFRCRGEAPHRFLWFAVWLGGDTHKNPKNLFCFGCWENTNNKKPPTHLPVSAPQTRCTFLPLGFRRGGGAGTHKKGKTK